MNSQHNWDRGIWSATIKVSGRDINNHLHKVRITKEKLIDTTPAYSQCLNGGLASRELGELFIYT